MTYIEMHESWSRHYDHIKKKKKKGELSGVPYPKQRPTSIDDSHQEELLLEGCKQLQESSQQ